MGFPREDSAKKQMRKCYENMTDPDLSGVEMINLERTTKNLQERFSEQGQYQKFVDEILGFDSSLIKTEEPEVLEFE